MDVRFLRPTSESCFIAKRFTILTKKLPAHWKYFHTSSTTVVCSLKVLRSTTAEKCIQTFLFSFCFLNKMVDHFKKFFSLNLKLVECSVPVFSTIYVSDCVCRPALFTRHLQYTYLCIYGKIVRSSFLVSLSKKGYRSNLWVMIPAHLGEQEMVSIHVYNNKIFTQET